MHATYDAKPWAISGGVDDDDGGGIGMDEGSRLACVYFCDRMKCNFIKTCIT